MAEEPNGYTFISEPDNYADSIESKASTLPHSIIINNPLCISGAQTGSIILTTVKNVMDNNPLEHFEFYLQHENSIEFTKFIPQYYPASNESTAIFNFYSLDTGYYTLFAVYNFSNGFFNQSGELTLNFTITPAKEMEVSYVKKDIPGMQFFDEEWELGKPGFIVFNFDSIKNGTPPFDIFYKELLLQTSYDTLFFAYPTPIDFTVWDHNNCSISIHDSIVILPDTLHIGISLNKPLIYNNGTAVNKETCLSIIQHNKPETLLVDWYKNGTLIKSGMEDYLFDVDTGDYYAVAYGQHTGLVSSNRLRVVIDSIALPIDTLILCDSTIIADFWLCSEFTLYDIGLAVNVSQAPFDSILWIAPKEAELLYEDYYELELQFNDTGIFDIGIIGYYNGCTAKKQVQVRVNSPYKKIPNSGLQQQAIFRNISLYPQPITSTSNLEIETTADALIDISIYNAVTGILNLNKKLNAYGNERTTIPLHYEKIHPGVSFIRIVATRNPAHNSAKGTPEHSGTNTAIGSNANDIRTVKIIKP
jgi:hypothetical protein